MRKMLEGSSTRKKTKDDKGGVRSSEEFWIHSANLFTSQKKKIEKCKFWKGQQEACGDGRGELKRGELCFPFFVVGLGMEPRASTEPESCCWAPSPDQKALSWLSLIVHLMEVEASCYWKNLINTGIQDTQRHSGWFFCFIFWGFFLRL